jgi:hypothetical protein
MRTKTKYSDSPVPHWWKSKTGIALTPVERVEGFLIRTVMLEKIEPLIEIEEIWGDFEFKDENSDYLAFHDDATEEGYEWIVTKRSFSDDNNRPSLDGLNPIEVYPLSSKIALHKEFIKCGENNDRILAFVRKYGFLGLNTMSVRLENGNRAWGECIGQWISHILYVTMIYELWQLYQSNASGKEILQYVDKDGGTIGFSRSLMEGRKAEYSHFDNYYYFDSTPVNLRIESLETSTARQLLSASLTSAIDDYLSISVSLSGRPVLKLEAVTLLGQIYLSLVEEILGLEGPLMKCAQCDTWFKSEHKGTMYCSDACKMKAYRARRNQSNGN